MFKIIIYFVIIAVFLNNVLAITDEQKLQIKIKLKEVSSECINDHPITSDDLASFGEKIFPETDIAACFTACIFNKVGIFDEKGILSAASLESAKVFQDEEFAKEIREFISTCSKVNDEEVSDGVSGCERAKLAFNCFVDNHEKFNFDLAF